MQALAELSIEEGRSGDPDAIARGAADAFRTAKAPGVSLREFFTQDRLPHKPVMAARLAFYDKRLLGLLKQVNNGERTALAMRSAEGKRLMYRSA
jgi:hypothetical protein